MPSIYDVYQSGSDYLKATDLQQPDGSFSRVKAVIERTSVIELPDRNSPDVKKKKILLEFVGKDKSYPCNVTNSLNISSVYGVDYSAWVGKSVIVTASPKKVGNDIKPGIDVFADQSEADAAQQYAQNEAAAAATPELVATSDFDDDIPF